MLFSLLPTPKGVVGFDRDKLPMSVKGDLGTETPSDKIKYLWRRWHKKHRIFAFWPKFLIYLSSSLDSESAWSMWH